MVRHCKAWWHTLRLCLKNYDGNHYCKILEGIEHTDHLCLCGATQT